MSDVYLLKNNRIFWKDVILSGDTNQNVDKNVIDVLSIF